MPDGQGGSETEWVPLVTVWARLRLDRGNEQVDAGRLEASESGVLTVRSSGTSREVTPEDRVIVKDAAYEIRSIINPDRRNIWLEMVVERGVAT